ncbi:dynactin subunit 1-like isoform X3 [Liolophura sinensis]|uniref:dynactin subunit 1-like isoform X3 n=1 Tax=Liolophura sinensis TaxID=3198878 RepID=UPI0031592759
MAEKTTKVGTRVEVVGKGLLGTVAYVGTTLFSSGKWVGVVLDEAKGKNNGTVQGKKYFDCEENKGIFVRQSQITPIGEASPPGPQPVTMKPGVGATAEKTERRKSGIRPPSNIAKSSENLAEIQSTPVKGSRDGGEMSKSMSAIPTPRSKLVKETTPAEERTPSRGIPVPKTTAVSAAVTSAPAPAPAPAPTPTPTPAPAPSIPVASPAPADVPSVSNVSAADISAMNTSINDKMQSLQQQQEMDGLNAEIKDLNEKLETLRLKRQEDRAKLKELEKLKLQVLQLQEYKTKSSENQSDLLRQLQAAKKETTDVQEAFDRYKEDLADLSETIEIATLDKEMAEEKAEAAQQEVEALKERVEELTVDLEILRGEISEKGTEGVAATFQSKQLEQQNERLKEALVKMRDLSNNEKHENQKMTKQIEKMTSDLTALRKEKEKRAEEIAKLSNEIIELKEQVDAALGAEEMVERLSERNLQLEEKIQEMEEEKADLEALNEMNEELQENAKETELEIREELDLANSKINELVRKLSASQESMADYENTISKFRELVAQLQAQNRELRSKQSEAEQKAETPVIEMFDYKSKSADIKAYAKTVDMELRKLDVQQANLHVQFLQTFMPDFFMNRGGDHDAVLVLLLIPRVIAKAELLASQVKEKVISKKFEVSDTIEREDVLKSHKAEQCSYANQMVMMLNHLQGILRQYDSALKTCSVDLFLKIGTLLPEMGAHEKSVDYFIDLLRKDQLDETVSLDLLDKSISYFQQLYSVLLANEKVDCTTLLSDQVRVVLSACDAISTDIARLKILLQPGQEQSEFSILLRDLETCNTDTKTCARKIRRRLPQQEGSATATPLMYPKEIKDLLMDCGSNVIRVAKVLQLVGIGAMQQAHLMTGGRYDLEFYEDSDGIMPKKMEEIAYQSTDKVYRKEDNGPYECLRLSFGQVVGTMNKIASAMENGEYDFDGTHEKKPLPPVMMRASAVKSQISDIEVMKFKLDAKDDDIKELKKQLKMKQEEMSEQMIRMGLVEKKLENNSKDGDDRVEKIQRKLDEANLQLKKKEKEYTETMDALVADVDALEQEKAELKERLKVLSKKTLLEGISRQSKDSAGQSPTTPTSPGGSPLPGPSMVKDSPFLLQQIQNLTEALAHLKHENARLRAEKMKSQLASLPPMRVPKRPVGLVSSKEGPGTSELPDGTPGKSELTSLAMKTAALRKEAIQLSCTPMIVDISKQKPGTEPLSEPLKQLVKRTTQLVQIQRQTAELQVEVTQFLAANRTGGQVRTDFSAFPTPQYAKVLHEKCVDSKLVGMVTIPSPGKAEVIPVHIQPNMMRKLHTYFQM